MVWYLSWIGLRRVDWQWAWSEFVRIVVECPLVPSEICR